MTAHHSDGIAPTAFTWPVISLRLRNLRNQFAREHPLWILKAVLLSSLRARGIERRPFLFHPRFEPFGDRVRLGRIYDIEVACPGWTIEDASEFQGAIAEWLSDPAHNFSIEEMHPIESRRWDETAARIEGRLDLSADEVCLDFITPFAFSGPAPDDHGVRRRIEPGHLRALIDRRSDELGLPTPGDTADPVFGSLRCLPWFWSFQKHTHRPKSARGEGGSTRQDLTGMQGPLYLRGPWKEILPYLVLCSELHIGNRVGNGAGRFVLHTARTFFDREISNPARYVEVCRGMREEADEDDGFSSSIEDDAALAAALAKDAASGTYRPGAACAFSVPKRSGGSRRIALLPSRDRVLHRAIHLILQPSLDHAMDGGAIGFRPGHGAKDAARVVAAALREGFSHAVETDIEAFFDQIEWDRLDAAIDAILPRADVRTRSLLGTLIRTPLDGDGTDGPRRRGLLQGSSLSPLLANLFLADFDRCLHSPARRLIRFGDDLIVLTRGCEEAGRALEDVRRELDARGLRIRPDKTAIASLEDGLDFLGIRLDADIMGDWVEHAALRMPVFIGDLRVMLGVDGETIVARRRGELLARYPMHRVNHLIVMGTNVLSTRLLGACVRRGIAVSLCEAHGSHVSTITPQRRGLCERAGRHFVRRTQLAPGAEIQIAQRIVEAKVTNYLAWLDHSLDPHVTRAASVAEALLRQLMADPAPPSQDVIRGWEGRIARELFPAVNRLVKNDFFHSETREPRSKRDPFNVMLDFAYHMAFARLDVLLRGQGLNPWLGFLHSPKDSYESLVCDLQEPFRARMDRLVVRSLNRGVVKPADFEEAGDRRWRLAPAASGRFFDAFEREMGVKLSGDPGSLRRLLVGQVLAVAAWAEGAEDIRFYRMSRPCRRSGRSTHASTPATLQ